MSELGDKIVKDVAGHVGHTAEDWSELRAELIALRQYHTMAEGFGPIQAANKRTESWKQVALDAQAKRAALVEDAMLISNDLTAEREKRQALIEALRELVKSMHSQATEAGEVYAAELEGLLNEHTR